MSDVSLTRSGQRSGQPLLLHFHVAFHQLFRATAVSSKPRRVSKPPTSQSLANIQAATHNQHHTPPVHATSRPCVPADRFISSMSCRYPRHAASRRVGSSTVRPQSANQPSPRDATNGHFARFMRQMAQSELDRLRVPMTEEEKDAAESALLKHIANKQFASYWLLLIRLEERVVAVDELMARHASVLPLSGAGNVLSMTAAVLRTGLDAYMARAWPIHYATELADDFMANDAKVDQLVLTVNKAVDNNVAITRDYIRNTLVPQVERSMAEQATAERAA